MKVGKHKRGKQVCRSLCWKLLFLLLDLVPKIMTKHSKLI